MARAARPVGARRLGLRVGGRPLGQPLDVRILAFDRDGRMQASAIQTGRFEPADHASWYRRVRWEVRQAIRRDQTELDLSDLALTELPSELAQATSLQRLFLAENLLTTLPTWLRQLSSLQGLYLSGNQFTALPAEVGQLATLQYLFLSENQLTTLPAELGQLTNLQQVEVQDNQLTTLPAEFGQLTNLWLLDLSGNQLTTLPAEFGQLTNLQELDLKGNPLEEPLASLAALGIQDLLAYLRGLPPTVPSSGQ
jgi:Leucine-rich repeat (LRR) protein